jgi:expansin (peptidoglycan-binding protein)
VDVTVVDRCVGCQAYDLDFSPEAFDKMADEALGRVDVTWAFLD